jgi:hypothetical protein
MVLENYSKSNLYRKVRGRHLPFPERAGPWEDGECSKFTAFILFLI